MIPSTRFLLLPIQRRQLQTITLKKNMSILDGNSNVPECVRWTIRHFWN